MNRKENHLLRRKKAHSLRNGVQCLVQTGRFKLGWNFDQNDPIISAFEVQGEISTRFYNALRAPVLQTVGLAHLCAKWFLWYRCYTYASPSLLSIRAFHFRLQFHHPIFSPAWCIGSLLRIMVDKDAWSVVVQGDKRNTHDTHIWSSVIKEGPWHDLGIQSVRVSIDKSIKNIITCPKSPSGVLYE